MALLFRSIAWMVTVMTIVFGVRPPARSLLDVLQRPSIQIVAITRRRRVEYAAFFMADTDPQACDADSLCRISAEPQPGESQRAPIHPPATRLYIPVLTA
jgi:hypothetical protein